MTENSIERTETIVIDREQAGSRMDAVLAAYFTDLSRSYIVKLIEAGNVVIERPESGLAGEKAEGGSNAFTPSKKEKVKEGDRISVAIPEPEVLRVEPENIPLEIVYEDEDMLVVNKPAGMVVHPAPGNSSGTLVNALMHHCRDSLSSINGVARPGIVHRIDKDTSGLLMVAKTDRAHRSLAEQLAEHTITRIYTALVYDNIAADEGVIDAPIARDPGNRLRNAVVWGGKEAITTYRVLERFGKYTLINALLKTGRTHQIRVHMKHIGHPLVGDVLYSSRKQLFGTEGQLLHAGVIGFVHPVTGEYMEFEAPLPEHFSRVLERLRGL